MKFFVIHTDEKGSWRVSRMESKWDRQKGFYVNGMVVLSVYKTAGKFTSRSCAHQWLDSHIERLIENGYKVHPILVQKNLKR